jgi:hypothetical protein
MTGIPLFSTFRRKVFSLTTASVASILPLAASAAPMTVGNLVVQRSGSGTGAVGSAAGPIAILEVTTSGSLAQTISFPTSGADQQTDSSSATSNGYINFYNPNLATATQRLSVPGYNSAAGTASVASTNTKVNSILDMSGATANRTLFPTTGSPLPFNSNNFRSSIATSGSTFYASGAGNSSLGGIWHFDGSAFTQVSTTVTNTRNVEIYGNQLFFSTGAGTTRGVYSVGTGLPTTSGQTAASVINMGGSAEAYGFVLFDTNNDNVLDRAYVADDRTTVTAGGINRFDFSGGSWTQTGSAFRFDTSSSLLTTGTAAVGGSLVSIRGLSGSYDAATSTATLFATTTETNNNRLISFLDTGSLSTSTAFTTLQSAGANYVFRGVDIVPVPEPSAIVIAGLGVALAGYASWKRRRAD